MQDGARDPSPAQEFERIVLPHLDAAYNLARWLVRNPHDAEDVVQEACLRAVRFFGGYQGGDARSWILRIVRNTAYTFLEKKRPADLVEEFDETLHLTQQGTATAETAALRAADKGRLEAALEKLPVRFREALILRELEGLSYKQIAEVMEIPMGSVMSSLARGRAQLRELLEGTGGKGVRGGLRG
jgi:RNA polymerase sigma-70 factor, ECF subfamily